FAVHGDKFPVKLYFLVGIGSPLLDYVGIDVVESPDEHIDLYVGRCHILRGESPEGAFFVEGVYDSPVRGEALDPASFQTKVVVTVLGSVFFFLHLETDIHLNLDIGQGVVILIGSKAEHKGLSALEGADEGKIAKEEKAAGACKSAIHETGRHGEGQKAHHRLDGSH